MTESELNDLILAKSNILWNEMWTVYSKGESVNTWLSSHRKEVEWVKDIKLLIDSNEKARSEMKNSNYEDAKKNLLHPSSNNYVQSNGTRT